MPAEDEIHLLRPSTDSSHSDPESFTLPAAKSGPHRPGIAKILRSLTRRPLGIRCTHRQLSRPLRFAVASLNGAVLLVLTLVAFSIFDALLFPSYAHPPPHYHLLEDAVRSSSSSGRGNPRGEKIFIASNIIKADLIRGPWGSSLLALIDLLGPENVFVSVYENDSGPESVAALNGLRQKLPCQHSIVTGAHLSLKTFPTIVLPNGEYRVKRLTYLEEVRNRVLWPLDNPKDHPDSERSQLNYTDTRFDRILFINDVYFNALEAIHLLFSTNLDPQTLTPTYNVACAIDFVASVMFYDTFVVRDAEGYGMGLMFFPWFTTQGHGQSRREVLAEKDAVSVRSCWGGMVAYEAAPFLRLDVRKKKPAGTADPVPVSQHTLPPLRFRHEAELYWEASECCLLNADLAAREGLESPGIYLNPYVRVAYDAKSWSWLPFIRRIERVFSILQYCVSAIGYPEHNPRRTEIAGQLSVQERWIYDDEALNGEMLRQGTGVPNAPLTASLSGRWEMTEQIAQPGGFCGQRRLFLVKKDLEKANSGGSGRNWEKGLFPPKL